MAVQLRSVSSPTADELRAELRLLSSRLDDPVWLADRLHLLLLEATDPDVGQDDRFALTVLGEEMLSQTSSQPDPGELARWKAVTFGDGGRK